MLQIKKRVRHFFVAFFLLTQFTQCAGENLPFFLKLPKNPDDVSFIIKELYLSSFEEKKSEKKNQVQEEAKKRNILEGKAIDLNQREISDIFLSKITTTKNKAFTQFFEEKKADLVDMRPITCDSWNLFGGSINNRSHSGLNQIMPEGTQIGKCCMAIRMLLPIDNKKALLNDQKILRAIAEDEAIYKKGKKLFQRLEDVEASVLSLFTKKNDPMLSEPYQKALRTKFKPSFYGKEEKYQSKISVELQRRLQCELLIAFMILYFTFVPLFSIYLEFGWDGVKLVIKKIKSFLTKENFIKFKEILSKIDTKYKIIVPILFLVFLTPTIHMIYSELKLSLTLGDYISSRIKDAKKVLEIAKTMDDLLAKNPQLDNLLGDKFSETRKILKGTHENESYNSVARELLGRSFNYSTWFDLFFGSLGPILTTMSLLGENIEMFDSILFELGMLETYFATATLIRNDAGNKNGFAYVDFVERDKVYLQLDGVWNVLIDPNKAIPNTFVLDGEKTNAVGVTGPNAAGKSVITTSIVQAPYWAQVLGGIVPCNSKEAVPMTIISAFFVFKEAGDDPNRNKSLFAAELELGITGLKIFRNTEAEGKIALGQFDEFFGGTNIIERVAAQESYAKEVIKNFKKSGFFFITHNIFLLKHLPRLTQVHIERYQDGGYRNLYTLSEGQSKEMVGIDLFERSLKEDGDVEEFRERLIKNARKKSAEIKKEFEELAKKQ